MHPTPDRKPPLMDTIAMPKTPVNILLPLGRELLETAQALNTLETIMSSVLERHPELGIDMSITQLHYRATRLRWLARTYTSIMES